MKVSVVIPTKNRQELILPLVKNLLEQDLPPYEIIIVDQTEFPLDFNLLHKIKINANPKVFINYIHNPSLSGVTAAKNLGVQATTGDIILFLDDDIYLYPDFIKQIVSTYQMYPEIGGVSGVQVQEQKRSAFEIILFCLFHRGPFKEPSRYIHKFWYRFKIPILGVVSTSGGISSYRREVFKDYLFDENLKGYALGNDFDFPYRCSKKFLLAINPLARATHFKLSKGERSVPKHYKDKVFFSFYFYKKNVNKTIKNYFYFFMCQVSIVLESIWACVEHSSFLPFTSTAKAYFQYFFDKSETFGL